MYICIFTLWGVRKGYTYLFMLSTQEDTMDTTVDALVIDAWFKGIEPEDVAHVLQANGIALSLEAVRARYTELMNEHNTASLH